MSSAYSAALPAVEMPTTNVGMPADRAAATAAIAPGVSSFAAFPLAGQFGWPSVASTMNLGFVSVRPVRYVTAASSAARVGVWLPLVRLPSAAVRTASAFEIAPRLGRAMPTATLGDTPHALFRSANNLRP